MKTSKPQSAGGKATAIILRKKALRLYYDSPNKCLKCCSIILPKEKQKISEVIIIKQIKELKKKK